MNYVFDLVDALPSDVTYTACAAVLVAWTILERAARQGREQ